MTEAEQSSIRELLNRWATAEVAADVAVLDELADDTFVLVGPAGFVLDKHQWLDRYRSSELATTALALEDVVVRSYGSAAVSVGVQVQQASYRGHAADGTFRTTHVAVRTEAGWRLAGQHLSPIMARR